MPTAIVQRTNLSKLADKINDAHTAIETGFRNTAQLAADAGDLLWQAKGLLTHGQWLPWLKDNFSGSRVTASVYMRISNKRTELDSNVKHAAHLSIRAVLKLLTKDDGEKQIEPEWDMRDAIDKIRAFIIRIQEDWPAEQNDALANVLKSIADEIRKNGELAA